MRALKKTVVLLLLAVTAVVGGCSDGYDSGYRYEPGHVNGLPGQEFPRRPAITDQPAPPPAGRVITDERVDPITPRIPGGSQSEAGRVR